MPKPFRSHACSALPDAPGRFGNRSLPRVTLAGWCRSGEAQTLPSAPDGAASEPPADATAGKEVKMPFPIPITPRLVGRRPLALGSASLAVASLSLGRPSGPATAQPATLPPVTPRQVTGPFYPVDWSGDADADLVRVVGAEAQALGTVIHLRGRVLDAQGRALEGAVVELWQCDANGLYRHPNDRPGTRDACFQGRGRAAAGPDGGFAFRTIRPVAYPGRTPHIHVAVAAPGRRAPLVTQLYVAGEPLNERDRQFNALRDPREREAVLMRLEPADRIEPGALLAARDIVLG